MHLQCRKWNVSCSFSQLATITTKQGKTRQPTRQTEAKFTTGRTLWLVAKLQVSIECNKWPTVRREIRVNKPRAASRSEHNVHGGRGQMRKRSNIHTAMETKLELCLELTSIKMPNFIGLVLVATEIRECGEAKPNKILPRVGYSLFKIKCRCIPYMSVYIRNSSRLA